MGLSSSAMAMSHYALDEPTDPRPKEASLPPGSSHSARAALASARPDSRRAAIRTANHHTGTGDGGKRASSLEPTREPTAWRPVPSPSRRAALFFLALRSTSHALFFLVRRFPHPPLFRLCARINASTTLRCVLISPKLTYRLLRLLSSKTRVLHCTRLFPVRRTMVLRYFIRPCRQKPRVSIELVCA